MSGAHQGIKFGLDDGQGWEITQQESTAASSYQEYNILPGGIDATIMVYSYQSAPNQPWPVAVYRFKLSRSTSFYTLLLIIPGALTTLLSFAVFWIPTSVADPLGYGISVIIVALLSNIILLQLLPVCGETLWIDLYFQVHSPVDTPLKAADSY